MLLRTRCADCFFKAHAHDSRCVCLLFVPSLVWLRFSLICKLFVPLAVIVMRLPLTECLTLQVCTRPRYVISRTSGSGGGPDHSQ